MYPTVELRLPEWISEVIDDPQQRFPTIEERMEFAIHLAEQNIAHGGGPFGAAVFEIKTGQLVAPGVNLVRPLGYSVAHAEAMAILVAQRTCGTYDLSAPGLPPMELVTSAQPCIQCYGIFWWSGLQRLIIGATKEDVESIAGFVEGPLPDNWAHRLAHRSPLPAVEVLQNVHRAEAQEVLRRYREQGGTIYHPGTDTE